MKRTTRYFLRAAVLLAVALFLMGFLYYRVRETSIREAKNLVSKVYAQALAKRVNGKEVEMRFYMSTGKVIDSIQGGYFYDALQLYQINPDNTVSPLGEMAHLPPNIVFIPELSTTGVFSDSKKKLSTIRIDRPDFGEEIDFYDLAAVERIPVKEGTLVIHADHSNFIDMNIPGFYEAPSLPVKQP